MSAFESDPAALQAQPLGYASAEERTPTTREVFLAWEKLRLLYVAILALPTLVIGLLAASSGLEYLALHGFRTVIGAVIANFLYFAGPAVEAYAVWLGLRQYRALRITLFTCGTTLSLLLGVPFLLLPLMF